MAEFQAWCDGMQCDDMHDARCLPLHVFDTGAFEPDLATRDGRDAFDARHGAALTGTIRSRADGD
jgi:hypothetical protein